jgi:L,D-peptidoglycan transpeptidase YkuD (ErfK/YbiS/YcfS/YnhG family)
MNGYTAAIIAGMLVFITSCMSTKPVSHQISPLAGARQLVTVQASSDTSTSVVLTAYDRTGRSWRAVFSVPAVIGRTGLAWGRGLHNEADRAPGKVLKREGDGKTPAGTFAILNSMGTPPRDSVRTRLAYERITGELVCIDDANSEHYNLVLSSAKAASGGLLPSHEDMLRTYILYRYVVRIGHNTDRPVPGAGSCIFLHIWPGSGSHTAGCTAVSEESMLRFLAWADPSKRPVIVQLTSEDYERLKGKWGLP